MTRRITSKTRRFSAITNDCSTATCLRECSAVEIRTWRVCDVGCGTGFLESLLGGPVRSLVAFDATLRMLQQARQKFPGWPISPLLKVAGKIVPEHRNRHRIRAATGQEAHSAEGRRYSRALRVSHLSSPRRARHPSVPVAAGRQRTGSRRQPHSSQLGLSIRAVEDSGIPVPVEAHRTGCFASPAESLSFGLTRTKA